MDLPVPSEDDPKTAMDGPKTRNFSSLAALATEFIAPPPPTGAALGRGGPSYQNNGRTRISPPYSVGSVRP